METPQVGEQIVGAYHKLINSCEIVSYNQRSKQKGNQMEVDVLAIDVRGGRRVIYICEVITHLYGMRYTGTPSSDRWSEYGSDMYQKTLEKILRKFDSDYTYVDRVFQDADEYIFQLWSPVVPKGQLTEGLSEVEEAFEDRTGHELELIINHSYSEHIDELQELASKEKKQYGESAFRFLQILEHMR